MKSLAFVAVSLLSLPLVNAIGQAISIAFTPSAGNLKLNGGQILVSANDNWGVQKAAFDLAVDFGRVTGKNLTFDATNASGPAPLYPYFPVTNHVNYTVGALVNITGPAYTGSRVSLASTAIIAGTIGSSVAIDRLVSSGQIDISAIKGKWESYMTQIVSSPWPGVERALVIAGSDPRGTTFGIYDISEQIGVSPWYYWADSPPQKHSEIYALDNIKIQGPPSIKYRGIFLNDEQPGLTDWVNNNYPPGKYGAGYDHNMHSHVFELLLRLRANYFWPTTWGSMFNVDDSENQPMADAHGIVMGSSHTEPMMRATKEWNNFGGGGVWEWDLNNASIYKFFETGARRAKPYKNSLFTMAMRGSGDEAIALSQAYAIEVVIRAVAAQNEIIGRVFNDTTKPDQMWCLYKEVQGYYEAGMNVPDDITLLWADDNWGNIRRLPIGNETSRSGGAGVYYHFDYVGDPRNYKWINTIQLQKTLEQMKLAYERQARKIWIVNVGDLKGLELPISHFLDLAYNTSQWDYDSVPHWLELWAAREFGSNVAAMTAKIMDTYGLLAARRKYELVDPTTYSIINYHEVDAVLEQWSTLASQALALYDSVAPDAQGAFYEMVLHPVLGGYTVYKIHLGAKRNWFYTEQKRNSANTVAQGVLADFNVDANLTATYHRLFNGKWKGIMGQPHIGYTYWQQPMRNAIPSLFYVQTAETSVAGNIGVGVEGSNATVPGDDIFHGLSTNTLTLPPMDPYGPSTRYIDIFARGTAGCAWTITSNASYVSSTPSSGYTGGSNGTDYRVNIAVNWALAPAAPNSSVVSLKFTSSCPNWGNFPTPTVLVPVQSLRVPTDFTGFVESDRHFSIEAEHTSRNTSVNDVKHLTIKNYGRTLSGVTLFPVTAPTQPVGAGPVLEYDLWTFTNLSATPANITLYITSASNHMSQARPLRYAIGINSQVPLVRQFVANYTGADMPDGWVSGVADSIWGGSSSRSASNTTTSHQLPPGKSTLKIWQLEPGFVLQKVVVDLGGVRPSYLGPPESFLVGRDTVGGYNGSTILG